MSADYSQIELRILAHLSGDEALIKAFNDGKDIHRFTAAEVLGKSQDEVTSEETFSVRFLIKWLLVRIAPLGARQKITRYAVRVEGYTKKLQTRYNKGVQANCKAKGEKYGTKGT